MQFDETMLTDWLTATGHPAYRLRQIREGVYRHRADSWDALRVAAGTSRRIVRRVPVLDHARGGSPCRRDGTEKLLLELSDGGRIECVLLRDGARRSICISTQVGCAMGCVFCASGLLGVQRNLSTGEMVEQMLRLQGLLPAEERLSHIVVMGMGEPLANLDQLLPALDKARREDALGISARRITISTVGIPAAIRRLARHAAPLSSGGLVARSE